MRTSIKILIVSFAFLAIKASVAAQTASSLFWRSDSLQVSEIVSEIGNQYNKVGHHGPAVENSHMALRLYFNDSGAIDVYSKTGRGMELMEYQWYPTKGQQDTLALGADGYIVGKTVGLGGIALWDGEKEVKLEATRGRTARAGDTKSCSYIEMIAYGVAYKGDHVDVKIRVEVSVKTREAVITASVLSGQKVQFLTGVNYHDGQKVTYDDGYISVWGPHPVKKTETPFPIGAGLRFSSKDFPAVEKTDDMVRIISKATSKVSTKVVSGSVKEAELNSAKRFEAYMMK